ncbi:MAG: hypothetical protein ISS82_00425 [Nanoarchaeota archaeon]|nr:hypothetical protein [Nanoarchaeota archaeon]
MNKKSAIIFFSVLVLLSLGALYVFGDLSFGDEDATTTTALFDKSVGVSPNLWVRPTSLDGSTNTTIINITIGFNPARAGLDENGTGNMTNFTVAIDGNNFSSWNFFNVDFGNTTSDSGADHEAMDLGSNATLNITNVTFDTSGAVFGGSEGAGALSGGWACYNHTSYNIVCTNTTDISSLGVRMNVTATLRINVTPTASTGNEQAVFWNITSLFVGGSTNVTNITTYVDDRDPRMYEINISDGNTTYVNTSIGIPYILSNGVMKISFTMEDAQLENVTILGYECNSTDPNFAGADLVSHNEEVITLTPQTTWTLDSKSVGESSDITCSFNDILGGNETLRWKFLANDTLNHYVLLGTNGTGAAGPSNWNVTLDDGELLPSITRINVSNARKVFIDGLSAVQPILDDRTSSDLDGTSGYLRAETVTFDIEISGGYKPHNVTILWNESTDGGQTTLGQAMIGGTGAVFPGIANLDETAALTATNITYGSPTDGGAAVGPSNQSSLNETEVYYRATVNLAGNASKYWDFWVLANNTGDNYTRISGPWRFQVDGQGPSIVMTPPTDTTIGLRDSITYKCTQSDDISGVNKIMWQLQKPEANWVTKQIYANVDTTGSDTITFTGDDTNLAGEYSVRCIAVDQVGNERIYTSGSTETFRVSYSTVGGAAVAGPSSAAKVDLSTQAEVTIKEKQGTITTFTLDGTTIHTITIKEVGLTTVTLVIESDPIEITLSVGETKEIDVDADGENDISITLNSIGDENMVDLTTKRLTPLPVAPTEGVTPTEGPAEVPGEAPSKTWLWILIIVIIVVIGVGYWFIKKK